MDKRILSSSPSGYIIISRLIDSTYKLVIGFPQNQWPDMNVTINVQDTNAGFLLKNYGKGDWGMINMQNMQLQVMQASPPPNMDVEIRASDDEFAKVLAAVVNDSSIAQVVISKTAVIAIKPIENKTEKLPVETTVAVADTVLTPVKEEVVYKPGIIKLMQDSTSEGLSMIYVDNANKAADTIIIFIPGIKPVAAIERSSQIEIKDTLAKPANIAIKDSRFIDMELQNPNVKTDSGATKKDDFVITEKKAALNNQSGQVPETQAPAADTGKVMINSDCKKIASENDFLKLRKQMAAQSSEKNMLVVAYKQFIKTCFITEQVKNLGVLFITQEEKYKFFVAAFPFISDTHNFASLDDQLTDNYYKTRFKAMLSR